jgi:acyl carrier protein
MMDKELVLKLILKRHFDIEPERVKPDAKLEEDLGLDEIEQIEFQMLIEKEFKIVFTPYEVDHMSTVQDCLDAINNKEV